MDATGLKPFCQVGRRLEAFVLTTIVAKVYCSNETTFRSACVVSEIPMETTGNHLRFHISGHGLSHQEIVDRRLGPAAL